MGRTFILLYQFPTIWLTIPGLVLVGLSLPSPWIQMFLQWSNSLAENKDIITRVTRYQHHGKTLWVLTHFPDSHHFWKMVGLYRSPWVRRGRSMDILPKWRIALRSNIYKDIKLVSDTQMHTKDTTANSSKPTENVECFIKGWKTEQVKQLSWPGFAAST